VHKADLVGIDFTTRATVVYITKSRNSFKRQPHFWQASATGG